MIGRYVDEGLPASDDPINLGLSAWYRSTTNTQGGGVWKDYTGVNPAYASQGTAPGWAPTPGGVTAPVFTGTGAEYLNVEYTFSLNFGSSYSFAAWVYIRGFNGPGDQYIGELFNNYNGANYSQLFRIGGEINPGTQYRFGMANESTLVWNLTDLTADTWYHIAGVNDGTAKFYLNGVLDYDWGISGGTPNNYFQNFTIGRLGTGGRPFNGILDDFRIYCNRGLTAQEVFRLYNINRQQKTTVRLWSRKPELFGTASSATTITANTATATAAAVSVTLQASYTATPNTAQATATAVQPAATFGTSAHTPNVATGTASAVQPSVSQIYTATANEATASATAVQPTISFTQLLTPNETEGNAEAVQPSQSFGTLSVIPNTATATASAVQPSATGTGTVTLTPNVATANATAAQPSAYLLGSGGSHQLTRRGVR